MLNIGSLLAEGSIEQRFTPLFVRDGDSLHRLIQNFPPTLSSKRMAGVEVELENYINMPSMGEETREAYSKLIKLKCGLSIQDFLRWWWHSVPDGSLRNNGIEFVSVVGHTFETLSSGTQGLEAFLSIVEPNIQVNARTGLHVHVDVRDFKLIDLQRLLLVTILFEDALFRYSGNRQHSIFCVPYMECDIPLMQLRAIHTADSLNRFIRSWCPKYMGVNLLPLTTQGTIEFRMHKGTYKARDINNWLNIISDLVESVFIPDFSNFERLSGYINGADFDIQDMARKVFPNTYPFILSNLTEYGVEEGLSKVKELCVDGSKIPSEYHLPSKIMPEPMRFEDIPHPDRFDSFIDDLEELRNRLDPANHTWDIDRLRPAATLYNTFDQETKWRIASRILQQNPTPDELRSNILLGERYRDLEGNNLPGNLAERDKVHIWLTENWGGVFYVHRHSLIEVFNTDIKDFERINAEGMTTRDYFIRVIRHGHIERVDEDISFNEEDGGND